MVKACGRNCQYKNNSFGVKDLITKLSTRLFSNISKVMIGIPLWEWISNANFTPSSYMNT